MEGDLIPGTPEADNLIGTPDNDTINGEAGNDSLNGGAGDDILDGGPGNDTIDGGAGFDTAVFSGAASNYDSGLNESNQRILTNTMTGEVDTLANIQRLQFDDRSTDVLLNPDNTSPGLLRGLGGDFGFGEDFLDRNDDGSTTQIDITPIFEDGLNFFGTVYSGLWINNNGSVTFVNSRSTFTPDVITGVSNNPEITPFFADVDTRGGEVAPTPGGNSQGSNLVHWDFNTLGDQLIVTWDDVGYFGSRTDLLNAFQLILTDRGNGDFDIQFRYEDVNWTTGNASGGANGLGGTVARAGFTAGTGEEGEFFELPQSGSQDDMLSLDAIPGNSGLTGIWEFSVRNGGVVESIVPLLPAVGAGGWVSGDPHLATLDGVGYDFQAAGEFVLLRGTDSDFELQARMVPVAENVSVNQAIATRLGGTAVMIDANDATPLSIGGVATEIEDFGFVAVGNDRIFREGDTYTIVYAGADGTVGDGDSQVRVAVREGRVDIDVRLNEELLGRLEGLLGDGDGDPANDVARADGTVLARPFTFGDLYGQFREDWRVSSEADSLFTYDNGESLDGFYLPEFPGEIVGLDTLDPAVFDAARQAALDAGLTEGTPNFNNAVLDFALTDDASFLTSASEVPATVTEAVETDDPVALTLTGTSGDDLLLGSPLNDTITGSGSNDTIEGRDGDDLINTGSGFDLVEAGGGDDLVQGLNGFDTLNGGAGNDTLQGNFGNDELNGGDGDDELQGGVGFDVLRGDAGNDLLVGRDGFDTLEGGAGNDTLQGNAGDDSLSGGDDDDLLIGGIGSDVMNGDAGNDLLQGLGGFDTLDGGDGADTLQGNNLDDLLNGGDGDDLLEGGLANDVLNGDAGNDTLEGGNGFDLLNGGDGDDRLEGNAGNDTLDGGAGDDVLRGGLGADTFVFRVGSGNDRIVDKGIVDSVALDAELLGGGSPDPADLRDISSLDADGFLLLDFGGGDTLTFTGITNTNAILDDVSFI
ncbi:bifunctional hemolysin/adenylate cyclase precursor [Roseovarius sp. A-2]|uniref:nidogen-like domain-containing protein n=1 Tax=Roseovarius sp. A-2 TaxID=1570360 RepID=UPI0009C55ADE|nr:nidogen-like domain-containing protein [Roseovarius sp. A-2]GAW34785.1 bifunctional hemolysin/adenylate cyclase precursor [Roseovarius sp. A-2]